MPELPEVETIAGDLRAQLLGARFAGVCILWPGCVAEPDPALLGSALAGQQIADIGRRGKYVVFRLVSGEALLVRLRMTGQLRVEPAGSPPPDHRHIRAWFDMADGRRLLFQDQRKFGRIWLLRDAAAALRELGPEPLEADFTPAGLAEQLGQRRAAVKAVLLDQGVLAGVGNIYSNEALFLAGIHPARPANNLTPEEIERLHAGIRQVLRDAVEARGTTLGDFQYRPPLGEAGAYQFRLNVHGRAGVPCRRCGSPIESVRIAQRSAYFCPRCQNVTPPTPLPSQARGEKWSGSPSPQKGGGRGERFRCSAAMHREASMPSPKVVRGQRIDSVKAERARELRRGLTRHERLLWEQLRANRLGGFHFRRQQVIDGFIADFYCHEAGLVVEVDGAAHAEQQDYDQARDQILRQRELRVLRVTNRDVDDSLAEVLDRVLAACREDGT